MMHCPVMVRCCMHRLSYHMRSHAVTCSMSCQHVHLARMQEIKDRDSTISEKEKRIYDLKRKNQELEKFKFVLDHKIKELKRQLEPKDRELASLRARIQARCS